MPLFIYKKNLAPFLQAERKKKHSIGLVPTMGTLHQGHLALVQKALAENDRVVVSIFVNPTQFTVKDDLEKYPRNLGRDLEQLQRLSVNIVVFAPTVDEVYGNQIKAQSYDFAGLDKGMEGDFRVGHFDGVGTIVELLLRTVAPDRAYFGEKDFQQLQIVKKMVALRQLPVVIIGCPTEREPSGLAMSSRNQRLSKPTRQAAGLIYQTLRTAKAKFAAESPQAVSAWVSAQFAQNPSLQLEYFQIADENTLTPLGEKQANTTYRAFIAVYADGVRLIDNLRLNWLLLSHAGRSCNI